MQKRVCLIPKIDFTDLPSIYKLARVFVLPSFFEGFGIPIIEALWSGTPVISSIDSCFSEAGGTDSIYVNPHDIEALAAAINRVWHDESLRSEMILRGSNFVKKFDAEIIGKQWIKLYQSLL